MDLTSYQNMKTKPFFRNYTGIPLNWAMLWFGYLVLSPIYIFPKGMPQPADLLLLSGMLPSLGGLFLKSHNKIPMVYLLGGAFACFTFLTNWVNFAFYPDQRLALSSLYYPYNFLVFVFVVALFKQHYPMIKSLTVIGIVIAIISQALWAEMFPDVGLKRMTGGFKNPNQLAYWALLSTAMLFFLRRYGKFNGFDFFIIATVGVIQSLALSKAGIISYAAFLIFMSFGPQISKLARVVIALGFVFLIAYIAFSPQTISNLQNKIDAFERVAERLDTIGKENDDSPEGRGYNRIVNNPEYLVLGAGEGAFHRFRTWASSNELHSGFATILFSYGIVGFLLLTFFIYFIVHKQPWYCAAIVFSVLLFSVSSQTIRFTHTWVLFGIVYATFICQKDYIAQKRAEQQQLSS